SLIADFRLKINNRSPLCNRYLLPSLGESDEEARVSATLGVLAAYAWHTHVFVDMVEQHAYVFVGMPPLVSRPVSPLVPAGGCGQGRAAGPCRGLATVARRPP